MLAAAAALETEYQKKQEREESRCVGKRERWGKRETRPYRISALLVLPQDTAREPRREQHGHILRRLHREQERGIRVGVLADAILFVAGVDEEFL